MTARERILMIRLMRKIVRYPAYARRLGIETAGAMNHQIEETVIKGRAGM